MAGGTGAVVEIVTERLWGPARHRAPLARPVVTNRLGAGRRGHA